MIKIKLSVTISLIILIFGLSGTAFAQKPSKTANENICDSTRGLSGLYKIDVNSSDRLYTVIEGATSSVPFAEQQQFFIDLAVRLTPPDFLAIECRGNRVSLGSSRSPRIEFAADGVERNMRTANGNLVRSRIWFNNNSIHFTSSGGSEDSLNFTFTNIDSGRRMRVTRRISAQELIEPVVIQTVYNKINEVARWDIFDESQAARQTAQRSETQTAAPKITPRTESDVNANNIAVNLRDALSQWIDATNDRDIEKQMSFYLPQLQAFYLSRNASRGSVRAEKKRVFAAAKSIDVQAAEPEIVFQDGGKTAVMRFRKKYNIVNGSQSRKGEVIQELRWQKTNAGWRIFSERDIKVLR